MGYRITRRGFLSSGLMATATLAAPSWLKASPPALERRGPARRVIVAGAGLAGLAAAYELTEAGHDVTVLEARNRPGGRVETLRDGLPDGLYVDAGAAQVFDNHHWTIHYARLFDVPLDPAPPATGAAVYHLRGRRLVLDPRQEGPWPVDLTPEEHAMGRRGMWERYVVPLIEEVGDPGAPDWPSATVAACDDVTFSELLRRRGASPGAVALLRIGVPDLLGDGIDATSALDLLREMAQRSRMQQVYFVRGGTDRLPRAMAARLDDRIRYGSPIVRIEQDAHAVRVVVLRGGLHTVLEADHLVCTLPLPLLGRVEISPPLSPEKRRAIAEVAYSSVSRVFLQCRKRFWIDEGLSGLALTDVPQMTVFDRTADPAARRGFLETYTSGAQARRLAALPADERLRAVMEQVTAFHPALPEHYEGGASKCWDHDPWSLGAYPWFGPGQLTAFLAHLGRPEGRLFFAGEHTSETRGWMQGAFSSAMRAAREVNEAAAHGP